MKEVSLKCSVDISIVFNCMNQLWEKNLKYDDSETLIRAVEEVRFNKYLYLV